MTFTKLDLSKYENDQIITDEEAVFFQKFFKNVKLPIEIDIPDGIGDYLFTISLEGTTYLGGNFNNALASCIANDDDTGAITYTAIIGIYEDSNNKFHIKWGEF